MYSRGYLPPVPSPTISRSIAETYRSEQGPCLAKCYASYTTVHDLTIDDGRLDLGIENLAHRLILIHDIPVEDDVVRAFARRQRAEHVLRKRSVRSIERHALQRLCACEAFFRVPTDVVSVDGLRGEK